MPEAKDQEPTIEEILASIREIITDETFDEKKKKAEEAKAAPVAPPVDEDADIMDLIDALDDKPPTKPNDADMVDPLAGIDLDLPKEQTVDFGDTIVEAPVSAPVPMPMPDPEPVFAHPPAPQAAAPIAPPSEPSLLDDRARSAAVDHLARLAANVAVARAPASATLTLEDMVREMLTPMLKDWLDHNLPALIERQVQRELHRLTQEAINK